MLGRAKRWRVGGDNAVLMKLCPKCGVAYPQAGRCPNDAEHRRAVNQRRNQRPQLKFWTSREWRKVRAMVIARDGGQCVRCGSTENLTVHHTSYAAPLDPGTCECLCRECHGRVSGGQQGWASSARLGVGRGPDA